VTTGTKALVALDDHVDRDLVERVVTASAKLEVAEYVEVSGEFEPLETGEVLIVACADFDASVGEYVSAARRQHPARPIVLVTTSGVNGHVAAAIGAGADDIVAVSANGGPVDATAASDAVVFSVEKALARKHGVRVEQGRHLGRLICVLGLKGGSGKTLTSANLAVSLAREGGRVAIVDLDLQFGDVGLTLGLTPERTIYDLVRSGGSIDAEKLGDFLTPHQSGVRALLAPARPDQAGVVTPEFLRDVYRLLREMHDYVVVDTPPSFTPEVIAAVDASTDACMVSMLDSPSLKNAKLGLETLELMDYQGPVRLVLNRADSDVGITAEDVRAIVGREPDVRVPSERNIVRSVNQGEPIALLQRRSEAARAFRALAELYLAEDGATSNGHEPRRRLLLRRGR
jgi:pilus assembly protein CpaE